METKSINFQDHPEQLQESFSFSSFDFNSSIGLFSEDDENGDEGTYIEIALDKPPEEKDACSSGDGEIELRISFSSDNDHSDGIKAPGSTPIIDKLRPNNKRMVKFAALDRVLNVILTALKGSSSVQMREENGHPIDNSQHNKGVDSGGWKLVRSRKTSKATTTTSAVNNGMMKFLIKFQSISIRSILASLLKNKTSSKASVKNYNWRSNLNQGDQNSTCSTNGKKYLTNGEKSKVHALEISLDSIRGVLETISMKSRRKLSKQAKSCPGSIKSSPVHGGGASDNRTYARDNSVQAAIAHCKRSFGRSDDFHF